MLPFGGMGKSMDQLSKHDQKVLQLKCKTTPGTRATKTTTTYMIVHTHVGMALTETGYALAYAVSWSRNMKKIINNRFSIILCVSICKWSQKCHALSIKCNLSEHELMRSFTTPHILNKLLTYRQCEWVVCEEEGQMCIEILHDHERVEVQSPLDLSSLFAIDAVENQEDYSLDHKGRFHQRKIQALEKP